MWGEMLILSTLKFHFKAEFLKLCSTDHLHQNHLLHIYIYMQIPTQLPAFTASKSHGLSERLMLSQASPGACGVGVHKYLRTML